MKKTISIISILTLSILNAFSQDLFTVKSGEVSFYSKTPVEDIAAKNKKPASILNTANNEIVVQMQIVNFKFPNSLMEEHFNENYMETTKFPTAKFNGKFNEKIDYTKDGVYNVTATGKLNVHGVSQDRTLTGKLTINKGELKLESNFDIALVDHKIEVPRVVFAKIAEKINVSLLLNYMQKK